MAERLDLHGEFIDILGTKGQKESRVYYQPPTTVKMTYPCIRYSKSAPDIRRADDRVYKNINRYDGVIIDSNPDSKMPDLLLGHFQMCSLGDGYTADNLNHFPFTIYY